MLACGETMNFGRTASFMRLAVVVRLSISHFSSYRLYAVCTSVRETGAGKSEASQLCGEW
jgi:hypothetical protein